MRLSTAALLWALGACSKSPQDKAREAQETIASWKTVVQLVDSANARRRLPAHWVHDVHESAAREIARVRASQ
jgi:hypothetical protein